MNRNEEFGARLQQIVAELCSLKTDFDYPTLRRIFLHYDPDVMEFMTTMDTMEMKLNSYVKKFVADAEIPDIRGWR